MEAEAGRGMGLPPCLCRNQGLWGQPKNKQAHLGEKQKPDDQTRCQAVHLPHQSRHLHLRQLRLGNLSQPGVRHDLLLLEQDQQRRRCLKQGQDQNMLNNRKSAKKMPRFMV